MCWLFSARQRVKYITGKTKTLWNHLKNDCKTCPRDVKDKAKAARGEPTGTSEDGLELSTVQGQSRTRSTSSNSGVLKKPKLTQTTFQVLQAKSITFNKERQEAFESDLVRVFATANFPLSAIEESEVRKFLSRWIPGAKVPWAKTFSGSILLEEVSRLEHQIKSRAKGKLATVQCDGWKDVSRKHLVAFMFTAERNASTFKM